MCVDMVAAMPGSRASHAPVITAPGLLVRGPSKVPVRVAGVAVKGKAARRLSVDHLKEKTKESDSGMNSIGIKLVHIACPNGWTS